MCANNSKEFILVIIFNQELREDIEEFFCRNATVIKDNSKGAEFSN
jgi:hypothetical protein